MNNEIAQNVLRTVKAHGADPIHESVVVSACVMVITPKPTVTDVRSTLEEMERRGYLTGVTREFIGRFWSLTAKGEAKAAEV